MQPTKSSILSDAKKRRLAALNQQLADGPIPQVNIEVSKLSASHAPTSSKAQQQVASAAGEPAVAPADQSNGFPYNVLNNLSVPKHVLGKLQVPASTSCKGSADDLLEKLMFPNMPAATARNMIATRTADKSVILDNPTAKLNITKPSKANRAHKQQLASKLLPCAERRKLSALPTSGLDYAAVLALHELWIKYITDLLAGKQNMDRLVHTADWHGALLRVTAHKHALYEGRCGIVVKATANTFVLVDPDGRKNTVPIKGGIFENVLHGLNVTVRLTGMSLAKLQCGLAPIVPAGWQ